MKSSSIRPIATFVASLLLLMLLMPAQIARAQDKAQLKGVALVIGQSNYEKLTPLPNPVQDAREIAKLLTDLGFDARSVTDRDASRLKRDLERFVEDAEEADVALLYYAGHGIEAAGENWLIPVDADASSLSNAREAFAPMSKIVEELQNTVPVTIVLLDACRTNPFPPGAELRVTPTGSAEPVADGGLTVVRGATPIAEGDKATESLGAVLGFAAEPGKPALDGAVGNHSPYAAALLRHLGASQGAEFGAVMRMVTEEVYLDTKGQQRPWTNESMRRLLYFGGSADEPTGDDGVINGERRQLLLTMADLSDVKRMQVESVATRDGVPLDAVYGVLRAMGTENVPDDPEGLGKALDAQAERLKSMISQRAALRSDDPQTATLLASADRAIDEGAIQAARGFLDKAVKRVEETSETVDDIEAQLKQKRIESAAIYARRAEASALAFDYVAAADDYARAFELVERWDDVLSWRYKTGQSESLQLLGSSTGQVQHLEAAIATSREAADLVPKDGQVSRWATNRIGEASALMRIGEDETDTSKLEQSIVLLRDVISELERVGDRPKLAEAQANIPYALMAIGQRNSTPTVLEEAVREIRAVLEMQPRSQVPHDWATTQSNLGLALHLLAERSGKLSDYEAAEAAYRSSLQVNTQAADPAKWATAMNNLGNTLMARAEATNDRELYDKAEQVLTQSLEIRTRETFPQAWARTQINLGVVNTHAARFESGTGRLQKAADAYAGAKEVFIREKNPLQWATITNNYASVLQSMGQRTLNQATIEQAIEQFAEARQVYTKAKFPLDWAMTRFNSGNSLQLLGNMRGDKDILRKSVNEYVLALQIYNRKDTPDRWALAMNGMATSYHAISLKDMLEKGNVTKKVNLEAGLSARRQALEILTYENDRTDWATAQNGLAMGLNNLGLIEQTNKYSAEAEAAYNQALRVYTREDFPQQWASQQDGLGDVFWNRGTIGKDKAAMRKALAQFEISRQGYADIGATAMVEMNKKKVAVVEDQLSKM